MAGRSLPVRPISPNAAKPSRTGTPFAAVTSIPITFDSFHNTNALRAAIGKHHMTITITTPVWMGANDLNFLDTTIVDPGTAVYDDYGIRLNYTARL